MAQPKGTLIRGADGGLFFIPEDKMQAFRLPDEHTTEARKVLDQHNLKAKGAHLPAIQGEGLVQKVATHNVWRATADNLQTIIAKKR